MENEQYYPKPKSIAEKFLNKLNPTYAKSILEPSVGKGDLDDVFWEILIIVRGKKKSYSAKQS